MGYRDVLIINFIYIVIHDLFSKKVAPRCLSGAPNIAGKYTITDLAFNGGVTATGPFSFSREGGLANEANDQCEGNENNTINFDASNCSSVYGRQSSRIVPDHYVVRYYIRYR